MPDRIISEEEKTPAENSTRIAVKTVDKGAACSAQGKGWFKGPLGMAICCGAPLLLIAAFGFFGLSLGAVASGAFSLAVLLACPVGMYLMMRMMMMKKQK